MLSNLAFITLSGTLDCYASRVPRPMICERQNHVLIARPQWFMWFSVLHNRFPDIVEMRNSETDVNRWYV